jgi:hypothetical protein
MSEIPKRFRDEKGWVRVSPEWALVIVILELIEEISKLVDVIEHEKHNTTRRP